MDSENEQRRPGLRERIGRRAWVRSAALVVGGLITGGVIVGTVTATAADEGTARGPSASQDADRGGHGRGHHGGNGDPSRPQRDDEEPLTGDTATRVTEAVLAEYPDAGIVRVDTDSAGSTRRTS